MNYFKYGNQGGIQKIMDREINGNGGYYHTLKRLLDSCKSEWNSNLKIKWYCFDERLNKDVYMVVADYSGHEQQFVSYFVEVRR